MSLAIRQRELLARRIAHGGDAAACTLRRRHTLQASGSGNLALKVRGAVLAGASAVDLDLNGPALVGTLPAGIKFTIAGDATVYTVAATAQAAANILTAVSFTPALAANAANDAAVTITQAYGDQVYTEMRGAFRKDDPMNKPEIGNRLLYLANTGSERRPEPGDHLASSVETVSNVTDAGTTTTPAGWEVVMGRAN